MFRAIRRGVFIGTVIGLSACAPAYGPGYPPGPGQPAPGAVVTVAGCVRPGVERGCLVLVEPDGGSWDIGAASPRPDPHQPFMVEATGRVAEGRAGFCQQGPILTDVQWRYTAVRCG